MTLLRQSDSLLLRLDLMNMSREPADNIMYPESFHLVTLLWNCRGLSNVASLSTARDLVEIHQPDVLLLTETRLQRERIQQVVNRFPLDGWASSDAVGFRGGIILMWNTRRVNVQILGSTEQEIHALIEVHNSSFQWLFSGIYASPRFKERKILWGNLETVAELMDRPWIVLGDFNEVMSESEKLGGGPISFSRALRFSEMLNNCCLTDLGFSGPRYT